MFGKIIDSLFKTKEEKLIEAKALYICDDLDLPSNLRRLYLNRHLPESMDVYVEKVKENREQIGGWMYLYIFNWMADWIETGNFHVYRGVLSLEGQKLMEILLKSMKQAIKYNVLTQEEANKNLMIIKKNILEVG